MDKKLSVLMVGPARDAQGGITSVINGYFNAGLQNLCNFRFVGTTSNGNYFSKAVAAIRALKDFTQLLPSCDIVHIHLGSGVSMDRKNLFLNQAKKYGKPVIIHDHRPLQRDFSHQSASFINKNRRFFAKADAVIVLSEGERDFYLDRQLCDPRKIFVIHNSVAVPTKRYFSFSSKKVISLAQMTERKGQDILIKAIPSIIKKVPQAQFVFAGNGDATPYRNLAHQLNIAQHCNFVGWVSGRRKEEIFEDATVYIQSSRDEGMAMGLLEAMARGIPVVATNVGGTSLVVHDGINGSLIPSCNINMLANATIKVLENEKYAQITALKARSYIEHKFNIQLNLKQIVSLYKRVLAKKRNSTDGQ